MGRKVHFVFKIIGVILNLGFFIYGLIIFDKITPVAEKILKGFPEKVTYQVVTLETLFIEAVLIYLLFFGIGALIRFIMWGISNKKQPVKEVNTTPIEPLEPTKAEEK